MDRDVQELRRQRKANPEDRELRDRLAAALHRSGAVEEAFQILEEAGAIGPRLLEALRQEDRPWPWNECSIRGNKWRWGLKRVLSNDYASCIAYENWDDSRCRRGVVETVSFEVACLLRNGHEGDCKSRLDPPCRKPLFGSCCLQEGHEGDCL